MLSLPAGARGGPLAISPDDSQVALVDGLTRVVLWDTATHSFSPVVATASANISAMVFAGQDQLAIGDTEGDVELCRLSTGNCMVVEKLDQAPLKLFALPAQDLLLASGVETLYSWNLSSGRLLRKLPPLSQLGSQAIAAIDPSEQLVAFVASRSYYYKGIIRLLDSKLNRTFGPELNAPLEDEYGFGPSALAFSPDGKKLASSYKNEVLLWDFDEDSWRQLACAIANRNLTDEEWDRYVGAGQPGKTCPGIASGAATATKPTSDSAAAPKSDPARDIETALEVGVGSGGPSGTGPTVVTKSDPASPPGTKDLHNADPRPVLARKPATIKGVASISPDEDWPVVDGQAVPLSGLDSIVGGERQRFEDLDQFAWPLFDCELSDDGATYRCFTPQRIDVAHAVLLNGGACVAAGADKAYYKDYLAAQAQAKMAKRGQWRYRAKTECPP